MLVVFYHLQNSLWIDKLLYHKNNLCVNLKYLKCCAHFLPFILYDSRNHILISYIGIGDMKVYLVAQNINDVSITMSVEVPLGKHQCFNWTYCYYACCSFCICDKSSLQKKLFVRESIIVYISMSMNYFENQIYDLMRHINVRWTNKVVDVSMHDYFWLTNAMLRLNESHVVHIICK